MPSSPATILFDGVCNLCNGFVQFVIRHDRQRRFHFAALQSEAARALLARHGQPLPAPEPDSVVLVENGRVYTHSEAILHIAAGLGGWWRALALGRVLPRPLRDAAYRWVARHRYQWFGRQNSCMLPTPDLKARFL
ncbi:thiol-disulfide oxidoreductase DCC family protein [Hymenobacter sp. ASUV-10]|uniref:Thiol-disulfide oxidoreductase DCC family protein n=1 Tax=Hymenobacter aranciens TaxID=3063996 RepID=A0ABT9BFY3_9BACT|nr:thiol-disulfide oxidoreductase DCC family protein [Hymenobacter sp. ASUV-10]MDO7877174.1 thiol-disulfide oxidoreductase DCC family protein [Hymenobacter sp. ASUV-10]